MLPRRLSGRLNRLLSHFPAVVLRKLWAIEIKRSSAPKVTRGFHSACADLKPNKRFVVYPGEERFSLDDETDAISVTALAEALQSAK
jgi:hypothetical protein